MQKDPMMIGGIPKVGKLIRQETEHWQPTADGPCGKSDNGHWLGKKHLTLDANDLPCLAVLLATLEGEKGSVIMEVVGADHAMYVTKKWYGLDYSTKATIASSILECLNCAHRRGDRPACDCVKIHDGNSGAEIADYRASSGLTLYEPRRSGYPG